MLTENRTGYTAGYTSRGMQPKFGVITDNVSASLTAFTKKVITAYTSTGFADDKCGYVWPCFHYDHPLPSYLALTKITVSNTLA